MIPDSNDETRFLDSSDETEPLADSDSFKNESGNANRFMETLDYDSQFPKEQEDIAAAVLALRQGVVSERKLSEAIRSWTIHGSMPLLDHLVENEFIDDAARQELADQTSAALTELMDNGPLDSLIAGTLEALDPSGRISRLLGIQAAAGAGSSDHRRAMHGYQLIRKIGQGGLGRVWLAFDESLKRHVAIKEISGNDSPEIVERFDREAVITGRLEHPGIVPIHQLGTEEKTGKSFYVMRFLGKTTLHDTIMEYHERRAEGEDDPMLIRRLLDDFVNVCQAIGHAHSRQVIHRDLKPENIAIDSFGQVIVIDWGIAKVIGEANLDHASVELDSNEANSQSTMQGQVLGSPLYMAPEQAAGRVDDLDERTDIYGLGAILFAILTGSAPHEVLRDQETVSGIRDLLSAIASHPTPNALETDNGVDATLAAICGKAMAGKQYARYQSAMELADDVQRWMAGEPVSAQRETWVQRAQRWVRQNQVWSQIIAACLIVACVAASTLAVAFRQNQLANQQRQFDELSVYSNEVEVQLQSTAFELMRNTRFMSTLPPIQAIVIATDPKGTDQDTGESKEVWEQRLATIYIGLLRANPNYRSVYYTAIESDQATPIVYVERHAGEMGFVRRLPASQQKSLNDQDFLAEIGQLSSADVLLTTRCRNKRTGTNRQEVKLLSSTPVFDETTGELFGFVTLEMDLQARVVQVLEQLEQSTARIVVTDSAGQAWVSDDPIAGIDTTPESKNSEAVRPGVSELFSGGATDRILKQNEGWIANRITLDPSNPQTTVGLVLELGD